MTLEIEHVGYLGCASCARPGFLEQAPSIQQLTQGAGKAADVAKQLGVTLPKIPELPVDPAAVANLLSGKVDPAALAKQAAALIPPIPGLPIDPGMVVNLLSGKVDPGALAKMATAQLANAIVPGLGIALGLAGPYLEKFGGAIADVLTGAKDKRDRRRRNWCALQEMFNYVMDQVPLKIYAPDGHMPSAAFKEAFKIFLLKPGSWIKPPRFCKEPGGGWLHVDGSALPGWLLSPTAVKNDYEGSNIDGRRTGVTYLDRALMDAELVRMLGRYYGKPGKTQLRDDALKKVAEDAKRKLIEEAEKQRKLNAAHGPSRGEQESLTILSKLEPVLASAIAGDPKTLVTKGAEGYIDVVAKWLALDKTLNSLIIKTTIKPHMKNFADAVLRKNPAIRSKVDSAASANKGKEKKSVDVAARNPGSKHAKKIAKALDTKKGELRKLAKQRTLEVRKAHNEARALRKKVAQMGKQLNRAQAAQVQQLEQKAQAGAALARNAIAQGVAASQLKNAVLTGQPAAAQALTNAFNKLSANSAVVQRMYNNPISLWGAR